MAPGPERAADTLAFHKLEGLGNDFLVIDARDEPRARDLGPDDARRLCDRRRGVGADGVLLVLPDHAAHAAHGALRMRVINADGSVPEMCGNGLRCVAWHAVRTGMTGLTATIATDAGPRACEVRPLDGARAEVTVDMGRVAPAAERSVRVDGRDVSLRVTSVGNPHAVLLADRPFDRETIATLGPAIATHAAFPDGVNVGFACVQDARIDLVVWERGVGLTEACGTGACAAAAVACGAGRAAWGAPITVRLPGGALIVRVDREDGRATMTGPATHVFSGEVDLVALGAASR